MVRMWVLVGNGDGVVVVVIVSCFLKVKGGREGRGIVKC